MCKSTVGSSCNVPVTWKAKRGINTKKYSKRTKDSLGSNSSFSLVAFCFIAENFESVPVNKPKEFNYKDSKSRSA